MESKRKISVFMASPGDLKDERQYLKDAIQQLNIGFGDGANVEFEPLGWEDAPAVMSSRNQGVINQYVDKCDVFFLVFNRRWGQPAPDAHPFSSYTEEEFHRALERWKKSDAPAICFLFKRVDPELEANPDEQLKSLMDFKLQIEDTRQIIYHYFDDEISFIREVDSHLRAYAKGELPKADKQRDLVIFPSDLWAEVEKAKEIANQKIEEAKTASDAAKEAWLKIEAMQIESAEDAANFAKEGKIERARQKFSKLVVESENIKILLLAHEFYYRTGDLKASFSTLEKWFGLNKFDSNSAQAAAAYGSLGIGYYGQGDYESAEAMYLKALAIHKTLGNKVGMAIGFGNLGNLYESQGDLEGAEEMHLKSLAIEEALGDKQGMASDYGNLGIVYQSRGDLKRAEEMFRKALFINEALDYKENLANNYNNLGILYKNRCDYAQAEEMYKKALVVNEFLGRSRGVAVQYANIGNLNRIRGDIKGAEELFQKALTIDVAIGSKEGMASDYGNLGCLYKFNGDFDHAEETLQKALAINEAVGRKIGIAMDNFNLGEIYMIRGEFDRAEAVLQKALFIFRELKSPYVDYVLKILNNLHPDKPE